MRQSIRVSAEGTPEEAQIALPVGEGLQLEFEQRASAGFLWRLDDECPTGLACEMDSASQLKTPGAASLLRVHVKPLRPGQFTLRFVLARPWRSTNHEAVFNLDLIVE